VTLPAGDLARCADMLAALGAEPRLRLIQLLVAAHPEGRVAGDLSAALHISRSTLSHHLDRLKREDLVSVRRDGTFLWYTVNTGALDRLFRFLDAECRPRQR
jgi:ArsR family transcriptional regulator, arsenate/arsenite/antimonite-responsive transcriptional repressor